VGTGKNHPVGGQDNPKKLRVKGKGREKNRYQSAVMLAGVFPILNHKRGGLLGECIEMSKLGEGAEPV